MSDPLPPVDLSKRWTTWHLRNYASTFLSYKCPFCPDHKIHHSEEDLWKHMNSSHAGFIPPSEDRAALQEFRRNLRNRAVEQRPKQQKPLTAKTRNQKTFPLHSNNTHSRDQPTATTNQSELPYYKNWRYISHNLKTYQDSLIEEVTDDTKQEPQPKHPAIGEGKSPSSTLRAQKWASLLEQHEARLNYTYGQITSFNYKRDTKAISPVQQKSIPPAPAERRIWNPDMDALPEHPPLWKHVYSKAAEYKRKAIELVLNGKQCFARPDSGSDQNIMTEAFAREHGVEIQRENTAIFKLGTGGYVRSAGKALVPFRLVAGSQSEKRYLFHILEKCTVPLIMGMDFLRSIQLYTKNKHLLVDYPSFGKIPMLKWIGSPKGQIDFTANGDVLHGCVDTGSDLDLMSLHCAMENGYKIDRRPSARTRVMLADETIVETIGQVHISSLSILNFENFEMTFHVLPNLVCDVLFGEEFLEQIDAFNTCDIINSEDIDIFSLNPFINLGPIQSFLNKILNRKWTPKANDTEQITHDKNIQAEIYRHNKAKRVISKIKDSSRAAVAKAAEENEMKAFDDRHARCVHCVGNLGNVRSHPTG